MSSATSNAATMHRPATAQRPTRPASATHALEAPRTLTFGTEEAAVLKLDLSDLPIPNVGGLQVDGFKPSFFQRLFGKK